ncbi:hypothetical protein EJ02DRAFT_270964 [Clathrospora elynae]|uniref:Uncharacterized protein n=1 Tax=Clathrospora elynae TaxID=706981 RepID=A0A6A5SHJ6_9PLEO|nr:hypothetical protein EJ02DRAFT_270964 [Clathrospora elynae]
MIRQGREFDPRSDHIHFLPGLSIHLYTYTRSTCVCVFVFSYCVVLSPNSNISKTSSMRVFENVHSKSFQSSLLVVAVCLDRFVDSSAPLHIDSCLTA